jgi:hypothetical protein
MAVNISTFSNLRPSKIDTNWDYWFENKPSGNSGAYVPTQASSWKTGLPDGLFSNQKKQIWVNFEGSCDG